MCETNDVDIDGTMALALLCDCSSCDCDFPAGIRKSEDGGDDREESWLLLLEEPRITMLPMESTLMLSPGSGISTRCCIVSAAVDWTCFCMLSLDIVASFMVAIAFAFVIAAAG